MTCYDLRLRQDTQEDTAEAADTLSNDEPLISNDPLTNNQPVPLVTDDAGESVDPVTTNTDEWAPVGAAPLVSDTDDPYDPQPYVPNTAEEEPSDASNSVEFIAQLRIKPQDGHYSGKVYIIGKGISCSPASELGVLYRPKRINYSPRICTAYSKQQVSGQRICMFDCGKLVHEGYIIIKGNFSATSLDDDTIEICEIAVI